jgi:hypothetical protein
MMGKGNGQGSKDDMGMLLRLQKKVRGKSVTCAQACALAQDMKLTKAKIGKLLDDLEVKITKCQLGCF